MNGCASELLDQIIATAKSQGLSQKVLAARAGLTAVGLSKAKQRGDLRVSSLVALAREVGLELTLSPHRQPERAAEAIKAGAFFGVGGREPEV
jgi:transcriptional regulator with XRE-family HTH domain